MSELIDRQKAKDAIDMALDHIDHVPTWVYDNLLHALNEVPSVQPEDWMERNKERILQAGMEGREIEFRIGGRLFAIREKAQ